MINVKLNTTSIVAPSIDPKVSKLAFGGNRNIRLSNSGNLEIRTDGGEVTIVKPAIYQARDGKRQEIEGAYLLHKNHTVTFRIGKYDNSKPLIIDPLIAYSTFWEVAVMIPAMILLWMHPVTLM